VLAETVREAARRFGHRLVVDAPDGSLTYEGLDRHADALASTLAHRGVREGDVVALVLPSGTDWLVSAAATSRLGAAVAGVSTVLSPPERTALVELVEPALVLATAGTVDGLPLRADVAVLEPGGGGRLAESGRGAPPARPEPHPDRLAAICFTSGTTGRPKAARFCERHLSAVRAADLGPSAGSWDGGSPMLASTQFAHVGVTLKLPWYLQTGSTLHVMDRWRPRRRCDSSSGTGCRPSGVVAPQLALMLRSPLMDTLDLSCVQD
jgi:acyl-CoA synthetase (AMP-forming)/AMP-acid ligase II